MNSLGQFTHWNQSSELEPFALFLKEFCCIQFSGVIPNLRQMHHHKGIEICYVVRGTYNWNMDGVDYRLLPGNAFVTCPWNYYGNLHGEMERGILAWLIIEPEHFDKKGELRLGNWSHLHKETQSEIGKVLANNENPLLPKDMGIENILIDLESELSEQGVGYREYVAHLLEGLLIRTARILQNTDSGEVMDEKFLSVLKSKMSENFAEKLLVAELAAFFEMSPSSFNNKVKSLTGFSPADYRNELKINHARDLLVKSNKGLGNISEECGFYSLQHFSMTFSKKMGINPSSFRFKNQEEDETPHTPASIPFPFKPLEENRFFGSSEDEEEKN